MERGGAERGRVRKEGGGGEEEGGGGGGRELVITFRLTPRYMMSMC